MNKFSLLMALSLAISCGCEAQKNTDNNMKNDTKFNVTKTESEWQKELSPEQYYILRQAGTERPGTGKYNLHFDEGVYKCGACGAKLFDSEAKFESHCGWPSFDKALGKNTVVEKLDKSHGMIRTEILCANCGGHLGHLFNDGPTETGMRYCINSGALDFDKEQE